MCFVVRSHSFNAPVEDCRVLILFVWKTHYSLVFLVFSILNFLMRVVGVRRFGICLVIYSYCISLLVFLFLGWNLYF